jgi:pimeloyl-ACP methyl ester carboxylesterase
MQRSNPRGLSEEFVDKLYDDFDRRTRRAVLALYRATPDPGEVADTLGPALAQLRKPALVVWGAKDLYADAKYAERQREYFEVQDELVLPDSGHWPFIDDPEPVEQAVVSFLRAQLP